MIPLYAFGVFLSFTISQLGMVHALAAPARRKAGMHSFPINLVGAIATGIVAVIAGITKFTEGAWIVFIVIPLLVADHAAHPQALRAGQTGAGSAHARSIRPTSTTR